MPTFLKHHPLIARVLAVDLICLLFLIDQISKWAVLEGMIRPALPTDKPLPALDFLSWISAFSLPRLDFIAIPLTSFFNIVMVWNEGISFGLMTHYGVSGNNLLFFILSAVVLGLGIWMFRTSNSVIRFVLALIIGGALGNLWDRVRFGAVADFLDFHIGNWHYPAFNVADSCIVIGVLILTGYELFYRSGTAP